MSIEQRLQLGKWSSVWCSYNLRLACLLPIMMGFLALAHLPASAEEDGYKKTLDKIFGDKEVQKDFQEHLKFEASNPLLSQEMRDAEADLAAIVQDLPAPPSAPDNLTIDTRYDVVFGSGSAPESLILFLDPGCVPCMEAFLAVAQAGGFDRRNLIIRWTPKLGLPEYMIAMYVNCRIADVNDVYARQNVATQLLSEKFKDRDPNELVNAMVVEFNLSFEDRKGCRTLEHARRFLENRVELHRQCARLSCEKGFTLVGIDGKVRIGFAPSTPSWFIARYVGGTSVATFAIRKGGSGLNTLKELLASDGN